MTPYEQFHSLMIGFQVDVLRYVPALSKEMAQRFENLGKTLSKMIVDADLKTGSYESWKSRRLTQLLNSSAKEISAAYTEVEALMASEMQSLIKISSGATTNLFNESAGGSLLQSPKWTSDTLTVAQSGVLVEGAFPADRWSSQANSLTASFGEEMRKGSIAGESTPELISRVTSTAEGALGLIAGKALKWSDATVRSQVLASNNEGHLAAYSANTDIIRGIRWVSTLDLRTSAICRALDGKIWKLPNYTPVKHNKAFPGPIGHFGCRSTQVPVLLPWDELMGNPKAAKIMEDWTPSERASMDGPVKSQSYPEWFKNQAESRQRDILGPGRLKLYQSGKLGINEMTDFNNRVLTLDQLKARYAS